VPAATEGATSEPETTVEQAIGTADSSDAQGPLFTSPDGDYTVVFPGSPTPQDIPVPLVDQTLTAQAYVFSRSTGAAFFASTLDYPPELAPTDVLVALEGARDGAVANTGATLTSSELIKRDGRRGMAFTFSVDAEGFQGVGTAVVFYESSRLSQAFAVGPVDELSDFEAFVDSFQFTAGAS
jgi:hypothetical protein